MRMAFTASGSDPSSPLDARFGRAACFLIYDTDGSDWKVVPNDQNVAVAQGAGVQAAQLLASEGVSVVVTGHCGPKALRALQAGAIAVYSGAAGSVAQALEDYRSGRLVRLTAHDVEGHW